MKKIKIGVLAPSEIAMRRFMPGIISSENFQYIGIASASLEEWSGNPKDSDTVKREHEKAEVFRDKFGGIVFDSFGNLINSDEIEAVYIPLPPKLHFKWAKKVLEAGKHILLEKPFASNSEETKTLLSIASKNNLAVHENFAFIFHKQIDTVKEVIESGTIGELRLIRTSFGFPYRGENDFRYHSKSGGGALLDCGGYPLRLADYLLGGNCKVETADLRTCKNHDVDVFGCATLYSENGMAQISFGMDNSYKCELEVWGSLGTLFTARVFTPTAEMQTEIIVKTGEERRITVPADDQFKNSADYFASCIRNEKTRKENYEIICNQSRLFDEVATLGNKGR